MSNKKNNKKTNQKKNTSGGNFNVKIAAIIVAAFAIFTVALFLIFPPGGANKTTDTNGSSANEAEKTDTEGSESDVKGDSSMSGKVTAVVDIKDYGKITVELDADAAPISVENFVNLAKSGFYDGLTFHRIIAGFMMQGGDPLGNGTGGSDKNIKGEFASNGVDNPLKHTRGAISMARAYDPNSASSQFFIVHEDAPNLDGEYACFGYVTDGIEVVDKVCEESVPLDNNGTIAPEAQPVINTITIED